MVTNKFIDTENNFEITGELDFRNAVVLIPIGSTLPDIVTANGQLYYFQSGGTVRIYFTVNGSWYYKDAV